MMDQPLQNPQDAGKKRGFWREPGRMKEALAASEFGSCPERRHFFFLDSSTLPSVHKSELNDTD